MATHLSFATGDVSFTLRNKTAITAWLKAVAKSHKRTIGTLSYSFVSDEYLLSINKRFLKHNTYTDIITFDYSSEEQSKNVVSGEIYISIDRVTDNAEKFGVSKKDELHRVMAHGLLHLCGFRDKTSAEQKRMRAEEENALALRKF